MFTPLSVASEQIERENYETQIEDLKLVLKATERKYEMMLDGAKNEVDFVTNSMEQLKHEYQNLKDEWQQQELHLLNSVRKSGENCSLDHEITRLVGVLKLAEEETCATRGEGKRWKSSFEEAASELICLKETIGEAKAESMRFNENLMNRDNELKNVLQENEELRKREAASMNKVEELSKLLDEALAKKQGKEHELQKVLNENEELQRREAALLKKVDELSKSEEALARKQGKENEFKNILQDNEELRKREAAALKNVEELTKLLEEAFVKKQGKEIELHNILQENDELRKIEAAYLNKVEELTKLLEEALARKQGKENELRNIVEENEELRNRGATSVDKVQDLTKLLKEALAKNQGMENELQNILQENEELQKRETASLKKVEELFKLLEEACRKQGEDSGLQNILQENGKRQASEAASLKKVELSNLLEGASAKKQGQEEVEVTVSEKHGIGDVKPKMELQFQQKELPVNMKLDEVNDVFVNESVLSSEVENSNGKLKNDNMVKDIHSYSEFSLKMSESCKIGGKDFSHEGEQEQEPFADELEPKAEDVSRYGRVNQLSSIEYLDDGGSSPSRPDSRKKKKPLIRKIGSLLKKGTFNQK